MKILRLALDLFDRFLHLPRAIVGALILLGIALNIANVIGRYVFAAPIAWAEEVMIFGMIWCIFLGAVLAAREDEHLKIDLLPALLPAAPGRILRRVVVLVVVAICAFVAVQSLDVMLLFADLGDRSPVAGIPKWLSHGAITAGFFLLAVATAASLARRAAGRVAEVADPPPDPPVRDVQ